MNGQMHRQWHIDAAVELSGECGEIARTRRAFFQKENRQQNKVTK